jgi:hypothetical protein
LIRSAAKRLGGLTALLPAETPLSPRLSVSEPDWAIQGVEPLERLLRPTRLLRLLLQPQPGQALAQASRLSARSPPGTRVRQLDKQSAAWRLTGAAARPLTIADVLGVASSTDQLHQLTSLPATLLLDSDGCLAAQDLYSPTLSQELPSD